MFSHIGTQVLQVLIQHSYLALAYNVKVGEQCLHEDTHLSHFIVHGASLG